MTTQTADMPAATLDLRIPRTRRWPTPLAPLVTGGSTHKDIVRAWLLAASLPAIWGVALFGPAALTLILVAIATAVGTEFFAAAIRGRTIIGGITHAALTGLLVALTLPATAAWYIAAAGSLVAIIAGKTIFGGFGHYLWHPALVGRVVVQLLFLNSLTLGMTQPTWPILSPDRVFVGDIRSTHPLEMSGYSGWSSLPKRTATDAVLMERPVQSLRRFSNGEIRPDINSTNQDVLRYEPLFRDVLPPWQDTILGCVPGGIGETCTLTLIVAGFYLIYRGYLRWQLPVVILAAAAIAAAIFPIESAPLPIGSALRNAESGGYDWFPIFTVENGRAVGVAYVLYHLTAGELMLGAFLLAGDMVATPMRARGQALFAAGVGVLTIFMRLYGVLECECYWSILIMNSLVRTIDARMKRPVLGMEPEAEPA